MCTRVYVCACTHVCTLMREGRMIEGATFWMMLKTSPVHLVSGPLLCWMLELFKRSSNHLELTSQNTTAPQSVAYLERVHGEGCGSGVEWQERAPGVFIVPVLMAGLRLWLGGWESIYLVRSHSLIGKVELPLKTDGNRTSLSDEAKMSCEVTSRSQPLLTAARGFIWN